MEFPLLAKIDSRTGARSCSRGPGRRLELVAVISDYAPVHTNAEPKPWYKRKASGKHRAAMTPFWVAGVLLVFFADDLASRVLGLVFMWVGLAVMLHGMLRSKDA
jgi:hypothetical protein